MKKIKILASCLLIILLCGCSSKTDDNVTKYNFRDMTFTIPKDFEVSEESYGLVVKDDDWQITLGTVTLTPTSTGTMNPWEEYLTIAKSIHPNLINTTYINQKAIQYVDKSLGLCIETYFKKPENTKLIRIRLFDTEGNHEKLLENENIKNILDSCELK